MQYGSKANLSMHMHFKLLRYLRIGRKLVRQIAQKLCKKLLEILEVAKKFASNLWKALERRGRGREATQ